MPIMISLSLPLPEPPARASLWQLLIDTNLADDAELGTFAIGEAYGVSLATKKPIGQTAC